jgi:hypothetical protein
MTREEFEPNPRGPEGEEPFNVTKFVMAAFNSKETHKWKRYVKKPHNLKMIDALKMAKAVHKPLEKILVLAEEHAELSPGNGDDRPGENDFLNGDRASA